MCFFLKNDILPMVWLKGNSQIFYIMYLTWRGEKKANVGGLSSSDDFDKNN